MLIISHLKVSKNSEALYAESPQNKLDEGNAVLVKVNWMHDSLKNPLPNGCWPSSEGWDTWQKLFLESTFLVYSFAKSLFY